MSSPITVFFSYAHEDESLRQDLEKQLQSLKRQALIEMWHDRNISAGSEWEQHINTYLNTSHIILLLISPDFIASDYCYSIEMQCAMERHEKGDTRVIPIILRPTDWEGVPFARLKALPTDGKPITTWLTQDEALYDVARGIKSTVYELLAERHLYEARDHTEAGRYEEALTAYQQALQYNSRFAIAYIEQADVLSHLKQRRGSTKGS